MRPIYKKVSIAMPHCPKCKEQLSGNNSIVLPWRCACGVWESNKYPFLGEYEVKPILDIINHLAT